MVQTIVGGKSTVNQVLLSQLSHPTHMELNDALCLRDRIEWRKWLERNHKKKKEVWLVHYKKHSGKAGVQHDEAVEEALCFGWIDSKLKTIDKEKFVLRYSIRKANSVWSRVNREKAEKMIKAGKMTAAGLATIEEAKKRGNWNDAYTNLKREIIPADLKRALTKDKRAWNNFRNFANTYWNMYVGWVMNAKSEETRRKRIERIVEQALHNKKLISSL